MPQPAGINLLDKIQIQARWVSEWRRAPEWEIHGIVSPSTIIWFILKGQKTLRAGDQVYRLQAGELVILPPHIPISVESSDAKEGELHHMAIGFDWKAGAFDFVKVYRFPCITRLDEASFRETLVETWRRLKAEFEGLQRDGKDEPEMAFGSLDQAHRLINCNAHLYQLTALLLQLLRPQLPAFPLPLDARVYEACEYIREHAGNKVVAVDIARHVFLSAPHLRMLFREALGMPLMEYVRQVRIERARELLSMTGCSLKEIAEQLGFDDQSQLSRAFRKAEGLSPQAYRRMWQLL